jgi:Xaa-Pro aminopeptidase
MWPTPSPSAAFAARRQMFVERLTTPAALGSGLRRVRNFEANQFPFRADSHFLYFTGVHLEAAVLYFADGEVSLYMDPPDPSERLWHGPEPTLEELETRLGLKVRPLDEFAPAEDTAAIGSPDSDSALWLEDLLGRTLELDPEHLGLHSHQLDPQEDGDEFLARALVQQRLCHDAAAIAQMRQAAAVSVAGQRAGARAVKGAERAAWVRAQIEAVFTQNGMIAAYGSIVTPSGNILHARTSDERLSSKDWLLVDAGAETPEGWAADITRTWPVSGKFDGLGGDLYRAVLNAQKAAIEACKPGVRFLDVHRLATRRVVSDLVDVGLLQGSVDSLLESGVGAALFPHGLGHLLGLDVHDMEDLGDRSGYPEAQLRGAAGSERLLRLDRVLEPGMVVTIEPGIYNVLELMDESATKQAVRKALKRADEFAAFTGIRIEDDVLITETGSEVLTADLPREPEAVMALLNGG